MKESIDRELLVRYIQDKCSADEILLVQRFLTQAEWQQALDELLEEDFKEFKTFVPDEELSANWNKRFQERYIKTPTRPFWRNTWLAYAAACLIVLTAGYFYIRPNSLISHQTDTIALLEKINPKGQRSKIVLADNSIVYLGADSRISFPERFGTGNREISLTGEAFFEITKDKKHPFIIHTGAVQTKVLGTSFKIDAFEGKHIAVSVATGKVRVDRKIEGQKTMQSIAVLIPGQEVNYNLHSGEIATNQVDITGIRDWKNGNLTFVATPLGEIADKLERWYNVKIEFENTRLKNYHVSLIVNGTAPLAHALEIICNTTHLHYTNKGNTFIISKTGGLKMK